MDEVMKEKVYCMPSQDNSLLLAELMNAKNQGTDAATMSALFSRNNDQMNNPMWLVWMMAMRWMWGGNGYNDGNGYGPGYAALQNQISDNQNVNNMLRELTQNQNVMQDIANRTNTSIDFVRNGICQLNAAIQQVEGTTKFSAERIINAANMGDTNIIMALKDCCCQNKELVQRMGYENQLGQKDLLFNLQQGHNDLGYKMQNGFERAINATERGFSATAYESQRQTCDIINAINASQQRTADLLNSHWKDEMSQSLQDEKSKNNILQQNIYLRDIIEKRDGCNCGC